VPSGLNGRKLHRLPQIIAVTQAGAGVLASEQTGCASGIRINLMRVRSQIASKALIYAFATPICGWAAHSAAATADDAADNAPQFRPCSLEQVQSRKTLYRRADISGVATPLLINIAAPSSAERLVRNGKFISFSSGNSDVSAAGVVPWRLETLDPAGRAATDATPLGDGNMIRLRTAAVKPESDKDPPLVIVKADVPDQNRPTTCDAQIRDGDFVFLHTISPSVWLTAAPAPTTPVHRTETMPQSVLVNGSADPTCVQDSETCVTDKTGGLVCAWAPSCAR
jgi:hypothetical protein